MHKGLDSVLSTIREGGSRRARMGYAYSPDKLEVYVICTDYYKGQSVGVWVFMHTCCTCSVPRSTKYLQCCGQKAVGKAVLLRLLLTNPMVMFLLLGS